MAIVTGTLNDFGLDALTAYSPEIAFIPSGPAVNAVKLLATRTVMASPGSDGSFTVDLAPTDNLRPERWYTIRIQWLDASGGYVGADFPDWRLYVPTAGGILADLIAAPWNPALVWVGADAPTGIPTVNTFWLDIITGDLKRWA